MSGPERIHHKYIEKKITPEDRDILLIPLNRDSFDSRYRILLEEAVQRIRSTEENLVKPDSSVPPSTQLQRERDQLAQENIRLRIDSERLKTRVAYLEDEARRLETRATQAEGRVLLLKRENQLLQTEEARLDKAVIYWRTQAERAAKASKTDSDVLDPEGYCRALGIDPSLLRTLPQDGFDELLTRVYRAYARVFHPDTGGDEKRMKDINAAYEFLSNPQQRRTYGR